MRGLVEVILTRVQVRERVSVGLPTNFNPHLPKAFSMSYITLPATDHRAPLCLYFEHFAGSRGAEPLILLHELGGSLESWYPFIRSLGKRFDIFAFDQRCAGRSEHLTKAFTLWDLADDAVAFADAVGIEGKFALMGMAMGAVTAAHVGVRYGARLSALVLCDGTPHIDANSSSYILNRAAKVRREGMQVVADTSYRNAFKGLLDNPATDTGWGQYRERFICNPPISYAMQSEALAGFHLSEEEYASILVPTLVLTGEHDFIWTPAAGEMLASKIPGARFETVLGAAHFPPLQFPEVVASRVSQFLRMENN